MGNIRSEICVKFVEYITITDDYEILERLKYLYEVITLHEIEVRKNGIVYCVYYDESCLPDKDTLKNMKEAGYKLYQGGKLYKPENKK